MSDIDPVEFGMLVQSVSGLTEQLDKTTADLANLSVKLEALTAKMKLGHGFFWGVIAAAGIGGAGMIETIRHLFK